MNPVFTSKRLRRTVISCIVIYIVDSFVIAQGAITLFALPLALLFLGFDTIGYERDYPTASRLAVIYVTTALAVGGTLVENNLLAERTILQMAALCTSYQSKYGVYPPHLSHLVPDYAARIPQAKFGVGPFVSIQYTVVDDGKKVFLEYTSLPPFGRKYYTLPDQSWRTLD